jgi:hypothetical protein
MTQALAKFQFGGHATFPVRYGWLPKGLQRLFEPRRYADVLENH